MSQRRRCSPILVVTHWTRARSPSPGAKKVLPAAVLACHRIRYQKNHKLFALGYSSSRFAHFLSHLAGSVGPRAAGIQLDQRGFWKILFKIFGDEEVNAEATWQGDVLLWLCVSLCVEVLADVVWDTSH